MGLLNTMNSATQYNVMPPLNWLPGECSKSHPRRGRAREIRTCRKSRLSGVLDLWLSSEYAQVGVRICRLKVNGLSKELTPGSLP
jgi:hypothetical protein